MATERVGNELSTRKFNPLGTESNLSSNVFGFPKTSTDVTYRRTRNYTRGGRLPVCKLSSSQNHNHVTPARVCEGDENLLGLQSCRQNFRLIINARRHHKVSWKNPRYKIFRSLT